MSEQSQPKQGDLKVWWNCNFGNPQFEHAVKTPGEAVKLLDLLASYDKYVHEQVYLNPEFSNAGGLMIFNGEEWEDWFSADGLSLDEWIKEQRAGSAVSDEEDSERFNFMFCGEVDVSNELLDIFSETRRPEVVGFVNAAGEEMKPVIGLQIYRPDFDTFEYVTDVKELRRLGFSNWDYTESKFYL